MLAPFHLFEHHNCFFIFLRRIIMLLKKLAVFISKQDAIGIHALKEKFVVAGLYFPEKTDKISIKC